ncbi:glycosyl transferase family 2 [Chthoniobacter flavus Ellin428]|uniref:Glycosyl transferase family 2 n=1 Tax=Chthoniobacter flavus Ellin428 TaxID=497964 RepID=B4CZX1_9BACT|nr:glycosyltransferase [Chthoniobacter flavus]EDY20285.1 glycosyl transferase family 2 [Chthoniobacter flavus Ellin428]TCO94182.1 glycosyl transferase family 2 [Chthoniobacter flavus]
MDISIILCTYNRAESLRRALKSLAQCTPPPGVELELVVVDNNSSDHTPEVCRETPMPFPSRYLLEKIQGKSFALNLALEKTDAPFLLFTDDDMEYDERWLVAHWEAGQRLTEYGFFGGAIPPRFESAPPAWFAAHASGALAPVIGYLNLGEKERVLEHALGGANMAIRRSAMEGLQFDTDLGRQGSGTVGGEENDLINRLRRRGAQGCYLPQAITYHCIPARRTNEAYIRKWFCGDGMTEVRLNQVIRTHPILGVSRYYWRQFLGNGLIYGLTRYLAPASLWLRAEIAMAKAWGVIRESRRRARAGNTESHP